MISKYGRYIPIVFLLILLFSIADIFITYSNLQKVRESELIVNHTNEVRLALHRVLDSLLTATTGERGYMVTADKRFLNRYTVALPVIQTNLQRVDVLTKDNPVQQKNLLVLKKQVQDRLANMQQDITQTESEIAETGSFQTPDLLADDYAKTTQIRNTINTMEQEELDLLQQREQTVDANYNSVVFFSAVTGLVSVFFILLAFYLTRRELLHRTELERAKDEFINLASHELKTPITSLKVYTSLLDRKANTSSPEEVKRYSAKIEEQANKITTLISNLLDISRIQTGKMSVQKEALNLDALIDETVDSIQPTTSNHEILIKGGVKKLVRAEKYRIYQVLVNLLTNAIKYSPKGGKIIVASKDTPKAAEISVQDQGLGIDKAYQQKIFERLYQVSDTEGKTPQGLGIGLYITSEIVKRHGGKIWLRSKKGKGTTFYFTIPYDD